MIKLMVKMLSALAVLGTAYRYRYKLLNILLGIGFLRKVSVNTMMNIPGIRAKLMSTAFRK
ncbi:hypothetical protein [Lederbergia panacisoli]|uniref:hypothetical protein n=1 Tax=Lederbergia panacisoli TaxID=1255251 RepID=UPI00214C04BD|nr:hypothetical protein [Lederbergia panacisoli]MCR2820395.1 hypothetical protein [Lederbergia panacisoli]